MKITIASSTQYLTLNSANSILAAALKEAQKLDLAMCIAICDVGGIVKAFIRDDNAWPGSVDIAMKKAKTAALFFMPTSAIGELSQPGSPLYQIEQSNGGLITFAGGLPLIVENQLIGAIGVSGSTVENDEKVAKAGAAAINAEIEAEKNQKNR